MNRNTDFEDTTMEWSDRLADEGRWQHARGRIRETWANVSDDELENARGNWDQLVGTIKERTGEAADAIERKLREWLS